MFVWPHTSEFVINGASSQLAQSTKGSLSVYDGGPRNQSFQYMQAKWGGLGKRKKTRPTSFSFHVGHGWSGVQYKIIEPTYLFTKSKKETFGKWIVTSNSGGGPDKLSSWAECGPRAVVWWPRAYIGNPSDLRLSQFFYWCPPEFKLRIVHVYSWIFSTLLSIRTSFGFCVRMFLNVSRIRLQ